MSYPEKLQKLCVLRGIDQATLAIQLGVSKSSISRIVSGVQEPKLLLANHLAQVLGVTLDYLVDDSPESSLTQHLVMLTEEEFMILKIVRRLGPNAAIDRLLNVAPTPHVGELRGTTAVTAVRGRPESSRFGASGEDLSNA
jgi:transcriptional regulator with XRE-family HTH domain